MIQISSIKEILSIPASIAMNSQAYCSAQFKSSGTVSGLQKLFPFYGHLIEYSPKQRLEKKHRK
jgi:hypothetical protein